MTTPTSDLDPPDAVAPDSGPVPPPLLRNRQTAVWAFLVAVTLVSWWVAAEGDPRSLHASKPITTVVVLIALVKVRLVIRSFMEVRTAPLWLRGICDAWLATTLTLLLTLTWTTT
jgi:hypothetical protein